MPYETKLDKEGRLMLFKRAEADPLTLVYDTHCEISLTEARAFLMKHSNNHERMLRTLNWRTNFKAHFDKCYAIVEDYKHYMSMGIVNHRKTPQYDK